MTTETMTGKTESALFHEMAAILYMIKFERIELPPYLNTMLSGIMENLPTMTLPSRKNVA